MASGTIKLESYRNASAWITWSSTTSGTSSIVTADLTTDISSYTYAGTYGELSVGGASNSGNVGDSGTYWGEARYLCSCQTTVAHDSSGNATVYIGGYVKISGGSYSGATMSGGATVTLDHIEMVQAKATTPVLSSNSVDAGGSLRVTLSANKSGLTHDMTWSFGSLSGTLCTKGGSGTYTLSPGYNFAAQIPYATSGVGTITCVTYNGSTQVGTKTVSFTVRIPDNDTTKPQISSFTVEPVNTGLPDALSGLYIQGVTKIKGTYSASSAYSGVRSYQLIGSGLSEGSGNPGTANLGQSGTISVVGRVTDNRGYYRDSSAKSITVLAYSKPTASAYPGESGVVCCRCDSGGNRTSNGIYLLIRAKKVWQSLNVNGTDQNSAKLEYRIKPAVSESWGNWVTLLDYSSSAAYISTVLSNVVSNAKVSYDVQLRVSDKLGEGPALEMSVPTEDVVAHVKSNGKGVAFFGYSQKDGYLELYGELEIGKGHSFHMGDTDLTEAQLQDLLSMEILDKTYPVGAIYMSTSSTSPASLFGGTWEQITGRFLLAAGGGYSAGATGGEAAHKLTVSEMPSHKHAWMAGSANTGVAGGSTVWPYYNDYNQYGQETAAVGGDQAHNNMPPYLAVYVWKRTA